MNRFLDYRRKPSKKDMISKLSVEKELLQRSEEKSKTKIEELEDEKRELIQTNQRLEFELKDLAKKVHTEEPYEKIYNERQDLKQNVNIKDSKIQELEDERKELNETIENLKSETKASKDRCDTLNADLESNRSRMQEISKEKQDLEQKIDEFEKEKQEYEVEITQLKEEFDKIRLEKEVWDRTRENKLTEDKSTNTNANAYVEATRQEISEYKNRAEDLRLASEALKSENEALFRANEAKAKEINEIKSDLTGIKQELVKEQLKYNKLQQEWDEEKRGTEFVLVSKSAKQRSKRRHGIQEATKEDNDSEDEHILGLVESARAETEALREKERAYRKRISELQTDKAELFRSGSNIFMENKSLKARYDSVLAERENLLKVESVLKRKVKEQDKEISDLKKTVDDMYYQNIAIKANDDNENKRNAYVVVMGNEMIKTLEREKSALHRRVKYLEKENNEIESRVMDLQKQSDSLIKYTQKYDKCSNSATLQRDSGTDTEREHRRNYEYDQIPSQKALPYPAFEDRENTPPHSSHSHGRDQRYSYKIRPYADNFDDSKSSSYRNYSRDQDYTRDYFEDRKSWPQRGKSRDPFNNDPRPQGGSSRDLYSDDQRPQRDNNRKQFNDERRLQRGSSRGPFSADQRPQRDNSRDLFTDDQKPPPSRNVVTRGPFNQALDPFRQKPPRHAPTYETFNTTQSQGSHTSLPPIDDRQSPRPGSHSSKGQNSRLLTPFTVRK